MSLEFKRIDDFLKLGIDLQNGDYLYEHDKQDYPLNNEFDLENFYFVTQYINGNIEITSMAKNKVRQININNLSLNWWIMKIPEFIRVKIGLQ